MHAKSESGSGGMTGFIGRRKELEGLESLHSSPGLKTCALYGRKDVGKTALLTEFCRGKGALYFHLRKRSEIENAAYMMDVISEHLGEEPCSENRLSPTKLAEALDKVGKLCHERRLAVVFDEFPCILEKEGTESLFQRFIDRDIRDTETTLILCGSDVSAMKAMADDPKHPLYGRFTSRCELKPMSCAECAEFHPNMTDRDKMRVYLTVGGIPKYHASMCADTYRKCLESCFFGPSRLLLDEPYSIMQDLKPFPAYSGIMACIADGKTDQKSIAETLRMPQPQCSRYLSALEGLGLAERPNPMLMKKPRSIPYAISEPILDFRYSVLDRHASLLRTDNPDKICSAIQGAIRTRLGMRFESVCREYIMANYPLKNIGKWWGRIGGEDVDIDIVAKVLNDDLSSRIFACECKFTSKPVGFGEYNTLKSRMDAIGDLDDALMVFFSGSGFEDRFREFAEESGIMLIGLEQLLGRVPAGPIPVPEPL